jgi:hypothetical protein
LAEQSIRSKKPARPEAENRENAGKQGIGGVIYFY